MNIGKQIFSAIGRLPIIQSLYKAGETGSADRTTIRTIVQDAKRDITPRIRTTILAKARHFEQNGGLITGLGLLFEQYTVGTGLVILPNSSDEEWNKKAAKVLEDWDKYGLLDSKSGFRETNGIDAWSTFIEGGFFLIKVFSKKSGRPRVQRIETHRVFTPPSLRAREGKDIIDGVEIDQDTGRPIAYYIHYGDRDAKGEIPFRRVDADYVVHVFAPGRVNQYREISTLYSVIDKIHDFEDLQHFEMIAAKDAGRTSKVVTNESGEATRDPVRDKFGPKSADQPIKPEDPSTYYQKVLGAETVYVKRGDKYEQFENERPSAATTGYWEKLEAQICTGAGMNRVLLYPDRVQGTIARSMLEQASTFFKGYSTTIARGYCDIYEFVLEYEIRTNPALRNAPPDWNKFSFRPPRSITVDRGYASRARIEEYQAGMGTLEDIYSEQGYDWRGRLKQKAKELQYAKKLAAEYDIPVESLISFPNSNTITEPIETDKSQAA